MRHGGNVLPAGRLALVDATRGVAALTVCLFHFGFTTPLRWPLRETFPLSSRALDLVAHFCVPVFFVLSGFVIARALSGACVDGRSVGAFVIRRSLRLDPPYWAALAIAVAVLAAGRVVDGAPEVPSPGRVLAHLVHLQGVLGIPDIELQFWTLPYEFQFYAVACLATWAESRLRERLPQRAASAVAFAPLTVLSLVLLALGEPAVGWFIGLWYAFFLGLLACRALEGRVSRLTCAVVTLATALVASWAGSAMAQGAALAAAALLALGLARRLDVGRARPLQWLGRVSYSLYLTHFVATTACQLVGHVTTPSGPWCVAILAAAAAGAVGLAAVFHRYVEAPSQAMSRAERPLAFVADAVRRRVSRQARTTRRPASLTLPEATRATASG